MKQTSLPAVPEQLRNSLATRSAAAAAAFTSATLDVGNVMAALEVAECIQDLRLMFDDPSVQARIVALQDTPLGFRTDRDPKQTNKRNNQPNVPYPYPVVRDAAIEALLRGLQLVGNQINIISSRMYCTREGFEYLIRRQKNVTDFTPIIGVPRILNGGALVECEATWRQDGTPRSLKVQIPVKSDEYSGADQIIGKATRKFLKRCFEMMTGNVMPEGDASEGGAEHVSVVTGAGEDPAASASGTTGRLMEGQRAPRRPRGELKASTAAPVTQSAQATPPAGNAAAQPPAAAEPPKQTPPPADAGETITSDLRDAPEPPKQTPPSASTGAGTDAPPRLPADVVEELLTNAKVALPDFFGWLVTTGRIQDASLLEWVGDVPEKVLNEILANNCEALRKCIRLYGA